MALLKAFSDARPEWGLSELARSVGFHKTTAYRLLTALEADGMVARNPHTDAWRLGHEAIVLGALALRSNDLVTAARPELEALMRETGETATVEILIDDEVEILDGVESLSLVGASSEIGTRWPAHATSTGKVLLADRTQEKGSRRLSRIPRRLPRRTPRTITDPSRLERELSRTRRRGWATAVEELEPGYVALAAPVRDHDGRAVAAISVGGPAARMTSERIREIADCVVQAANRATRRLGGRAIHERTDHP